MIALLLACNPDPTTDSGPTADYTEAHADAGPDVSATVGEGVTLDGSASIGAAMAWDFGDGLTDSGAVVEHTYTDPGTYGAVLTVTDDGGGWRSDTAVVTITAPLALVAPTWARTLALVGDALWVVTPEADQISIIDLDDGSLRAEVPVCAHPRTLSHDPATAQVAVACEIGDAVWGLDADDASVAWQVTLPEGSRPYGVVGRDGQWHATLQGTSSLVTIEDGKLIEAIALGPDPRGIALAGVGEILVTRFRSRDDEAGVYRIADGNVETLPLVLDEQGDSDTTTGGVPNLIEEIAPSPDGGRWYVPMLHANVLRGTWRSGETLDFQTSLRGVLASFDADTRTEVVTDRKQFDERGRASAVAFSPGGDRVYVLHPGAGAVTVLSTSTDQIVGSILDIGAFPTGLVTSADGTILYVYAWLDRTVLAYDVTSLSTQPEPLWSAPTLSVEPLSATELLGKRTFHDARDTRLTKSSYISCAHCHPDGRDDGLTWDFTDRGEGLRNTTSLEARAGAGMGPLHWTGNFDEIQDFEHDMRGPFAGEGFLSDEDWAETNETLGTPKAGRSTELDALATWLETLSLPPVSPHPVSEAGEDAFFASGCDDCHPPPLYTDSADGVRHDVGTLTAASGERLGGLLDGVDTPTLLGTWATAPYLHDGSAETIEDALTTHAALDAETAASIADFVRGL
ncbi:MAG: DNA-binding beta-propeller fold protein YncE [Myxococcota bacterium]|jgi:DNA-binding beta-propeller fold protein YncE